MGHPLREVEILHRDGAQDAPAHTQIQVPADAVLVPDSAAHLDVEATLSGNGGDGVKVGQGAVLGAVQVHQMEVAGPRLGKGLQGGILGKEGGGHQVDSGVGTLGGQPH